TAQATIPVAGWPPQSGRPTMSKLTERLDELALRGTLGESPCDSQDALAVQIADELRGLLGEHDAQTKRNRWRRIAQRFARRAKCPAIVRNRISFVTLTSPQTASKRFAAHRQSAPPTPRRTRRRTSEPEKVH